MAPPTSQDDHLQDQAADRRFWGEPGVAEQLGGSFFCSADILPPSLRDRFVRFCLRVPEVRDLTLGAVESAADPLDGQRFSPDSGPEVPLPSLTGRL